MSYHQCWKSLVENLGKQGLDFSAQWSHTSNLSIGVLLILGLGIHAAHKGNMKSPNRKECAAAKTKSVA